MAKRDYINTGKCIWCGRSYPKVSFNNKPHIVPHNMGGDCIGVDVCDECNSYFGTSTTHTPSTNLVFKEVFQTIRFFSRTLTPNSYKKYHSAYFKYSYSKNALELKLLLSVKTFTTQFKRSLYEVFLQKYHYVTGNGHDRKFNYVRSFARYSDIVSDLKVYYAYNKIILAPDDNYVDLPMSDALINDIDAYGFFCFYFKGHNFFLETDPIKCALTRDIYLQEQANKLLIPVDGTEHIHEITNIFQLDFLMNRFYRTNFNTNNKIRR